MHAWSTSMLFLLHSAFMLSMVKLLLKGEVGVCTLNSHGNCIVDHGKSWKNHGIVFLNFYGNHGCISFSLGHLIYVCSVCHCLFLDARHKVFRLLDKSV